MGRVVDGQWIDDETLAATTDGRWERPASVVRGWVRADGSTAYAPEAGRYHLWLAWNCTWSQRTMIVRNLLGLRDAISTSLAHVHRNEGGWWFREGVDDLQPSAPQRRETWDRISGFEDADPQPGLSLHEVYVAGDAAYTGRATVPLLWDRVRRENVSNESAEILRMIEVEFRALQTTDVDLLPADLLEAIDATNAWVYTDINNGVYRAGFASTQVAYEDAVAAVFTALDHADALLSKTRYLCGDVLTEADVRLFPTLVRFDAVYFAHFKCSRQRIADYAHLGPYLRDLYQTPGFADTVDLEAYQLGYMGRSERLNPTRIIPTPPRPHLDAPHDRDRLGPRRFASRA